MYFLLNLRLNLPITTMIVILERM